MADLLDANVWIGLTSPLHSLHRRATHYWRDEVVGPVAFCRTTALGLVRVLSGKHSTGGVPLRFEEAWRSYLLWRADEGVVFLDEPSSVEQTLGSFIAATS